MDTEKILKKHKKYSELIILYETKGLHHRALELLEKQADQADSSLRGHERTVQYLQHLGTKFKCTAHSLLFAAFFETRDLFNHPR